MNSIDNCSHGAAMKLNTGLAMFVSDLVNNCATLAPEQLRVSVGVAMAWKPWNDLQCTCSSLSCILFPDACCTKLRCLQPGATSHVFQASFHPTDSLLDLVHCATCCVLYLHCPRIPKDGQRQHGGKEFSMSLATLMPAPALPSFQQSSLYVSYLPPRKPILHTKCTVQCVAMYLIQWAQDRLFCGLQFILHPLSCAAKLFLNLLHWFLDCYLHALDCIFCLKTTTSSKISTVNKQLRA